jgi:ABC-type polysaccharide/polyol phosphate export permease
VTDSAAAGARGTVSAFRQLVAARELLWSFVQRDLIVRYRTPVMGVGWALATPLAQMAIFTVVFTRVARIDVEMPYPLYAYIGLMAWTLTAASLREATMSLAGNPVLVTKVRFPREVLPVASVCTALTDFFVAVLLAGGLMWYYSVGVPWTAVLLPAVLLVHLMLIIGLALLLAVANLLWRDVRHMFDVVITVWMFASAVVYPVERVGGRTGAVLALNPMTHIVEAYRDVLVRGRVPATSTFALVSLASASVLVMSWLFFRRSERRFAELA